MRSHGLPRECKNGTAREREKEAVLAEARSAFLTDSRLGAPVCANRLHERTSVSSRTTDVNVDVDRLGDILLASPAGTYAVPEPVNNSNHATWSSLGRRKCENESDEEGVLGKVAASISMLAPLCSVLVNHFSSTAARILKQFLATGFRTPFKV